jgi:hypothetical protein
MAIGDVLLLLDELLLQDAARRQLSEGASLDSRDADASLERGCVHGVTASGYQLSTTIADALTLLPQWRALTTRLSLTRFERCVLLLALAPEVDLRYRSAFGYLNQDPAQRAATRELALRLFTPKLEDPAAYRHYLADGAPMMRLGLIRSVGGESSSWVGQPFTIHPAVAHFLLGADEIAPYVEDACRYSRVRLGWEDVPASRTLRNRLMNLVDILGQPTGYEEPPIICFESQPGSGENEALSALATALASGILYVDVGATQTGDHHIEELLRSATVHQILHGSLVVFEGLDAFHPGTGQFARIARAVQTLAGEGFGPVIVCSRTPFYPLDTERRTITIRFDVPGSLDRVHYWRDAARDAGFVLSESIIRELADRFTLSHSQIRLALRTALDSLRLEGYATTESDGQLREALFTSAGARTHMDKKSISKVPLSAQRWDDLRLPETTLGQVYEIARAVRSNDDPRAERRAQSGGLERLTILCGMPMRQKAIVAAMIAQESQVELYRVDVSSLVSKYIGETEKNIDQVFASVEDAGAVLFLDEADALLGKRTDVQDAHDRYANQEVSYLLNRIEAYEGLVILATNDKSNIDPALLRRTRFIIELPRADSLYSDRYEGRIAPPS